MPRPSLWQNGASLSRLALGLVWLAFLPAASAVDPPPDGGYPNGNTAEGEDALFSLNNNGQWNTAIGYQALYNSISSVQNTAVGYKSLFSTYGSGNTAIGYISLLSNSGGFSNSAIGSEALALNTLGAANTATGAGALRSNTTASHNTAHGYWALYKNTTGAANTANGYEALYFNLTGTSNTATGWRALFKNTASNNTANGYWALNSNTTGHDNTALGYSALFNLTTGSNNIGIGPSAGTNLSIGSNNIYIGAYGSNSDSSVIRIGRNGLQTNAYITGIHGTTVPAGVAVLVDSDGHLGTMTSSARYKEAIEPMGETSEAILELQPVSFRYKKEIDPAGLPQFGLVAEEVEKVDPDLVARDGSGKPYSVRYEAVNAMLLNEFIKDHRQLAEHVRRFEEHETTIARQEKEIAALKAQADQIQQVSDRLEATHSVPRKVDHGL